MRRGTLAEACAFVLLLITRAAGAQQAGVVIHVEQLKGGRTVEMAPKSVFLPGDVLRFRLTSVLPGYLYVVDQGTSGTSSVLFPTAGADHLDPGRTYSVPAEGDGWFQVNGPPGFDVIYFVLSAAPLPGFAPSAAAPGKGGEPALPGGLLPRCDDVIFKSRGECQDASAGPEPLAPGAVLPREIEPIAGLASRDIMLVDDAEGIRIEPARGAKLPIIYTFRLAHR